MTTMSKTYKIATFAAVSCVHCPHAPQSVLDWVKGRLEEIKPTHFIMLGDLFDATSASVHPNDTVEDLEVEFEHGANVLSQLRGALPVASKLIWTLGNHDDNIITEDPRRTPRALRSLLHWNNHYEFGGEFRKWKQIPYKKNPKGIYRLGPCRFFHGFRAAVNSNELETLEMRESINDQANTFWIRGHTHKPVPPTQCRKTQGILLPWWYANAGTIGPLDPPYMDRKNSSQWGHGLISGECSLSSPRRPSRTDWDANLEIFERVAP